ncbi:MAG: sulfatase [Anaerolineaceae bacterium]|nr:sulfatase [Anaerolineaceae bacterium]|tara:strand:- start:3284 stop:4609 length:1326 start_codon:yes stop_codon:yes gene_type:complete
MKSNDSGRPNIVFLIADDHRHNAINALGDTQVKTPHLDSLIREGTSLTNMYIMGSTVGAVCMPSRGMMLTGRTLWKIDEPDLGNWLLWPQMLRESGYHTYGIGKWHNERRSFSRCFAGGAETFFGGMSDHYAVPVHDYDPSGKFPEENARVGQGFSTDIFAEAAVEFLQQYSDEEPFCLYVAFTAPHDPRTPPSDFTYNPNDLELPDNFLSQHPFDNGEMYVRDELLADYPRTDKEIKHHLADYYGMISHLDSSIGKILSALDDTGVSGNTIVVYTADHGLAVGQHGLLGKQNLYEHSIKVPFLIRGPQVPVSSQSDAFCYLYDFASTLCDMLDISIPPSFEGRSFWNTIINGDIHRHTVFSAYKDKHRSIRDNRYKLIKYYLGDKITSQMFDLLSDPLETDNLIDNGKDHPLLSSMESKMSELQTSFSDPIAEENSTELL